MDKIGYFSILPRELIDELHKYFFAYFRDISVIVLDADIAVGHLSMENKDYIEWYYVTINVRFPKTEYTDLTVPFDFQFQTLKLFLENIIEKHTFLFIDRKQLKLSSVEPEHNFKIDEQDKIGALDGRLFNKYEQYVPIHLDFYGRLRFILLDVDGGILVELYRCTLLQTEVLIYKLVQLYNGMVTKTLASEY